MRVLSSLTNRIFLAAAALAVLTIAIAIFLVNAVVKRQAEETLAGSLEDASALVEQYRAALFEHFIREARLVADLPKLKAAVFENHPPTVQPIAEDYQRQIGSDLLLVTNARGQVLARVGPGRDGDQDLGARPAVRSALEGRAAISFWPRAGEILQVVAVPVWIDPRQPEILGTLTVGFSLDRRMALQFKQLTNSDIAFAMEGQIQASTLDPRHWRTLASALGSSGVLSLQLDNEEYATIVRPLTPLSASVPFDSDAAIRPEPGVGRALSVILRSRTAALEFLNTLQTALAGTALVALLAAILLSYAVARTVTRPLDTITTTMREIAATGDLTRRIELQERSWVDEDTGLLARTFNALTESIVRFQREAAQRERLSSLGRLSTVIAHEIRNPLMIIKAALRTLKRDGASTAQVQQAAASVEEEVARLNRIVTEVLDFARPIRFDFAPADLSRLCADAAAAVASNEDEPGPAFTLQPAAESLGLITDGERLRLALVNVLANARQAVLAADSDGGGRRLAPIELGTTALANDRVAIVVRDYGIGIRAEDLPRVFDPYFTTKRTGSGLGLAIARNIVEGLGGSITVSSRVGQGTEIRIELPRRPPGTGEPPASPAPVGAGQSQHLG